MRAAMPRRAGRHYQKYIVGYLPRLALAFLLTLSACAGGDNSSPAQTNQPAPSPVQSQAPAPAQSPAPVQPPAPAPAPTPGQTQTPAPPAQEPAPKVTKGQVTIKDITLSGISASLTPPPPLVGGQETPVFADGLVGHDDRGAGNIPWDNGPFIATVLNNVSRAEAGNDYVLVTQDLPEAGSLLAVMNRWGVILAGEGGDLIVAANYILEPIPGVQDSGGSVDMELINGVTGEHQSFGTSEPGEGAIRLVVPFKPGEGGQLTLWSKNVE